MFYVYIIRSIHFPDIVYVGFSNNLEQRLNTHNSGGSIHTSKYKPWQLEMYLCFKEENKARLFEKYLKTQSGRAFAQKRF
ncbi:MAG TPA: GIY-YIG nuclease family protein [Candidatus Saccharimonadales bacterium]|nr:GIY-YIG nuclease family protein [Candidatus Saccharimonadales bacterium]